MTYSQSFVLIAIAVFCVYRIYRNKLRPIWRKQVFLRWCKSNEAKAYMKLMRKHYKNVNGFSASRRERRETANKDASYTYGEIRFLPFAQMLQLVSPKPGKIFYDIGAGTGKVVMAASFLYDFSAVKGIELLDGIYGISLEIKNAMQKEVGHNPVLAQRFKTIQLIQDDIFKADFSDADVIFINATCFGDNLWQHIKQRLNYVKSGTRIILVTRILDLGCLKLLSCTKIRMSWDYASIRIYQRR